MQAEDLCQTHLRRKRLYGDPLAVKVVVGHAVERFWSRVDKDGPLPERRPGLGQCWLWTGYIQSEGYGTMSVRNRLIYMHRFSYELHVRPIPDGMHIDHLCRNTACVRPDHLEPVPPRENTMRGDGPRLTSERCFGVPLPEGHRQIAAAARKATPADKEPRECEHCGRVFTGRQALGVHKARAHNEHAPRWPRSQAAPKFLVGA